MLEAIQPVTFTPLNAWLDHGENRHYVVKNEAAAQQKLQLPNFIDTQRIISANLFILTFEWSDDRIYCSELVWKLYKQAANIRISALIQTRQLQPAPVVRQKLKARYGDHIPLGEPVIPPSAIFDSPQLVTVAVRSPSKTKHLGSI